MPNPWESAKKDDPDLPGAEVTLTAFITVKCLEPLCSRVKCDFRWFRDDGGFVANVDTGPVSAWQRDEAPGGGEQSSGDGEEKNGDVNEEEFRVKPPEMISSTFEQSPVVRGTCAFVRNFPTLVLQVRVSMPDAASQKELLEVAQRPPSPVPAGKDNKAAGKKKDDPLSQVVVTEVKQEVQLPLVPLLFQPPRVTRDGARVGGVITQDFPLDGLLDGFTIGVRVDKDIMSDDVAAHLNPLLLTFTGMHRLPDEGPEHGQTRDNVYAVLNFFGENRKTEDCSLNARGSAKLCMYNVYFVGTWPQHELREHLQTERLTIEVHDRDPPKKRSSSKETASQNASPRKGRGSRKTTAQNVPREIPCPHGLARVSLNELLSPHLTKPLHIRAVLEPICRGKRDRTAGGASSRSKVSYEVSDLFGDGAKELLASMEAVSYERVPSYVDCGSYVTVTAQLARPLQRKKPDKLAQSMTKSFAEAPPVSPKAKAAAPATPKLARNQSKKQLQPDSRELFTRLILVMDYAKTTMLKRLLTLVADCNVKALGMDSGQTKALVTVELTQEQKEDPDLDILTGFIVMDRETRIVVIEGLREGAMLRVAHALGIGNQKNTKEFRALFNPGVGFISRLYADFNLCLKQIKLRQPTLEVLTQRPDLYDDSYTDTEVNAALQNLMEMKRAERLHVLNYITGWPSARSILTIETQYGKFVANQELEGGCIGIESRSQCSRRPKTTSSGSFGAGTEAKGPGLDDDGDEDMDDETDSDIDQLSLRKCRLSLKAPLDQSNPKFDQQLKERQEVPGPNIRHQNKVNVTNWSEERKQLGMSKRKPLPDASFLEGQPVHIYSSQTYNSAELQKQRMREAMNRQGNKNLWTYSAAHNSGCFPMMEKEVRFEELLRENDHVIDDHREPFRYPKQRCVDDFKKQDREVSEARKDELRCSWDEPKENPRSSIFGSRTSTYDAGHWSTDAAHAIPLRRAGIQEPPAPAGREPVVPPMKFSAKISVGVPSTVDKYKSGILEGDPQYKGIDFSTRIPQDVAGRKTMRKMAVDNIEIPPVSLNQAEDFCEAKGNSDCPFRFAAECARPVVRNELHGRGRDQSARHQSTNRASSWWSSQRKSRMQPHSARGGTAEAASAAATVILSAR